MGRPHSTVPPVTTPLDCTPEPISVEEARANVLAAMAPLAGRETVATRDALGRVLADALPAPADVPSWPNAAMDGYALAARDLAAGQRAGLVLAGQSLAGRPYAGALPPGGCVRITTGAMLPEGADTVVMQEYVRLEADRVFLPGDVRTGDHVRRPGEDLRAGATVLPAGLLLCAADLALAASVGAATLAVHALPRVALFTTGDELRPLGTPLPPGAIYDSNRYLLTALLARLGVPVVDLGIVADDPAATRAAFEAARDQADVVLSSGGVSVGDADYVRDVFAALGEIRFWRIRMKPGRPLAFGRLGDAWFFGLPGNPVSSAVTFIEFVRPALLKLMGTDPAPLPRMRARLAAPVRKAPGRTDFQRGLLGHAADGTLSVRSAGGQGSHVMSALAAADCLMVLPAEAGDLPAGAEVDVELLTGVL
jgi:molybdopterin molybdotransferase